MSASAALTYTAVDLGTLGGSVSAANAISAAGQVVGQSSTSSNTPHAFSWTSTSGMVDLGTLGGTSSDALAVNSNGQVVGWAYTSSSASEAFIWTAAAGMTDLGIPINASPFPSSTQLNINDAGQVVGTDTATGHAFSWTSDGGIVDLGTLGGTASRAEGVSPTGQVIGQAATANGALHAFSWTSDGGMLDLDTLGSVSSDALAVSDAGQVVGHVAAAGGALHAFSWTSDGGMLDLGTLGGGSSDALGVNHLGQVAGVSDTPTGHDAFTWTGASSLTDVAAVLRGPFGIALPMGINDSGQIVGTTGSMMSTQAFSWTAGGGVVDLPALGGVPSSGARAVNGGGAIAGWSATSTSPQHAVMWQPPVQLFNTLSTSVYAKLGASVSQVIADFTYPCVPTPCQPASVFSATIAWGDGSASAGVINPVKGAIGAFYARLGRGFYSISGTHTYGETIDQGVDVVTVTGPGTAPAAVTGHVSVLGLSPTPLFSSDPSTPTNGDIALVIPAPAAPKLQYKFISYNWTFDDGNPVTDNARNDRTIKSLLSSLAADPTNTSSINAAVTAGVLPSDESFTSDPTKVAQLVTVWQQFFPQHIVPHVYLNSGTRHVTLQVTDRHKQTATVGQDVTVADHCLPWGGPWFPILSHYTTCDTAAGFSAVVGGPQRRPDYYSFDISGSIGIGSAGVTMTVTHDGTVYLGAHAGVGVSSRIPGQVSMSEGFVGPPSGAIPDDTTIDGYVNGTTIPVNVTLGSYGLVLVLNPSSGGGGEEYAINGNPFSIGLTLQGSCSISLGKLSDFAQYAVPTAGPWPDSGAPAPHLTRALIEEILNVATQDWTTLASC